jgi:hypothetical protein
MIIRREKKTNNQTCLKRIILLLQMREASKKSLEDILDIISFFSTFNLKSLNCLKYGTASECTNR